MNKRTRLEPRSRRNQVRPACRQCKSMWRLEKSGTASSWFLKAHDRQIATSKTTQLHMPMSGTHGHFYPKHW